MESGGTGNQSSGNVTKNDHVNTTPRGTIYTP